MGSKASTRRNVQIKTCLILSAFNRKISTLQLSGLWYTYYYHTSYYCSSLLFSGQFIGYNVLAAVIDNNFFCTLSYRYRDHLVRHDCHLFALIGRLRSVFLCVQPVTKCLLHFMLLVPLRVLIVRCFALHPQRLTLLEGFASLPNLRELNVSHNSVQNMLGLASNTELRVLRISYNRIRRIEGLHQLKHLDEVRDIQSLGITQG